MIAKKVRSRQKLLGWYSLYVAVMGWIIVGYIMEILLIFVMLIGCFFLAKELESVRSPSFYGTLNNS